MNAGTPLTVPQVADILGCSKATLHRRIADGTFPVKPHFDGPGRKRLFPAGVVHFYALLHKLPESPAELAEFLDAFPITEAAS